MWFPMVECASCGRESIQSPCALCVRADQEDAEYAAQRAAERESSIYSTYDVDLANAQCADPEMHGDAGCGIVDEPEGGAWLKDKYGVPYWSPTGEPGVWAVSTPDPKDIPHFTFVSEREIERQQRLIANAAARGDVAGVAILSGHVRTYAARVA